MPVYYGLEKLYLFPYFQTREAYKTATGKDAPPFDPQLPVKSWFHPDPTDGTGTASGGAVGLKITYQRVIAYGQDGRSPLLDNGSPYFETLQILKSFAAKVNIPPHGVGIVDQPVLGEVPPPCRALYSTEHLILKFGGTVGVIDTAQNDPSDPNYVPPAPGSGGSAGLTARQSALLELLAPIYKELVGKDPVLPD